MGVTATNRTEADRQLTEAQRQFDKACGDLRAANNELWRVEKEFSAALHRLDEARALLSDDESAEG